MKLYVNVPRGSGSIRISTLLFVEALSGGLRVFFIFTSFARLPLGDSTTILSSSPVIVMMLSTCFLREQCGVYRVVAATGLLAGVILISKPPFIFAQDAGQTYDSLGYSLVICACVMSALGIIFMKVIATDVDREVILFYLGLSTAVLGTLGLFLFGQPSVPGSRDGLLAMVVGLVSMGETYVLLWAVQLESAARVMVVRQLQIVMSYAVQVIMFGTVPTWTDLLGAAITLLTVLSIPLESAITRRLCPATSEDEESHLAQEEH